MRRCAAGDGEDGQGHGRRPRPPGGGAEAVQRDGHRPRGRPARASPTRPWWCARLRGVPDLNLTAGLTLTRCATGARRHPGPAGGAGPPLLRAGGPPRWGSSRAATWRPTTPQRAARGGAARHGGGRAHQARPDGGPGQAEHLLAGTQSVDLRLDGHFAVRTDVADAERALLRPAAPAGRQGVAAGPLLRRPAAVPAVAARACGAVRRWASAREDSTSSRPTSRTPRPRHVHVPGRCGGAPGGRPHRRGSHDPVAATSSCASCVPRRRADARPVRGGADRLLQWCAWRATTRSSRCPAWTCRRRWWTESQPLRPLNVDADALVDDAERLLAGVAERAVRETVGRRFPTCASCWRRRALRAWLASEAVRPADRRRASRACVRTDEERFPGQMGSCAERPTPARRPARSRGLRQTWRPRWPTPRPSCATWCAPTATAAAWPCARRRRTRCEDDGVVGAGVLSDVEASAARWGVDRL